MIIIHIYTCISMYIYTNWGAVGLGAPECTQHPCPEGCQLPRVRAQGGAVRAQPTRAWPIQVQGP